MCIIIEYDSMAFFCMLYGTFFIATEYFKNVDIFSERICANLNANVLVASIIQAITRLNASVTEVLLGMFIFIVNKFKPY